MIRDKLFVIHDLFITFNSARLCPANNSKMAGPQNPLTTRYLRQCIDTGKPFLIRFLIQHKCTTRGTGLERATRAPMGGMSLPNGSLDGSACSTDGAEFPETATDD